MIFLQTLSHLKRLVFFLLPFFKIGKNHDIEQFSDLPNITCLRSDRTVAYISLLFSSFFSHYFLLPILALREHGKASFYFPFAFILATLNKNARQLERKRLKSYEKQTKETNGLKHIFMTLNYDF